MSSFIKKFIIDDLFGFKDIQIDFNEPYKVLVGENGSGKTTIMNCLFYTLTRKFDLLVNIRFTRIRIEFSNGHAFDFTKNEIFAFNDKDDRFRDTQFYRMLSEKINENDFAFLRNIVFSSEPELLKAEKVNTKLKSIGFNFNAPSRYVYSNVQKLVHEYVRVEFEHKLEVLDNIPQYSLFYFPTFRRVESSVMNWAKVLERIHRRYPFVDRSELSNFVYDDMIQFGMQDVKNSISKLTSIIKTRTMDGFSTIMGSMLSQLYKNEDDRRNYIFEEDKIRIILDRLGENVKKADKEAIVKYASSGKLDNKNLNYLIGKLITLYKDQEVYDVAIKNFRDICNGYLQDKKFVYDESSVDIRIESDYNKEILDLECLSSGEKQIVSLFSKIYLDVEKAFVMLLDEPELSLSIFWQEKLLPDIIASNKCKFLLAVTHSPFIYSNNEMRDYAAGLTDFVK